MPKIPLYEQQQQISGKYAGRMLDLSPEIQAIGEIASIESRGIRDLTKGIQKLDANFKKLKVESDVADADTKMLDFDLRLGKAKQEFLLNKDKDGNQNLFKDLEEKVIIPLQEKFLKELEEQNYTSSARKLIFPKVNADFASQIQTQRVNVFEVETKERIGKISEAAQLQIAGANTNPIELYSDNPSIKETGLVKKQAGLDTYDAGVAQIESLVQANYIDRATANEMIAAGNENYFSTKVANVTSRDYREKLEQDPRWAKLKPTTQANLLIQARDNFAKYNKETTATNIRLIQEEIKADRLTLDQLEQAEIPNDLKPGFKIEIEDKLSQATQDYYLKKGEDDIINLEEIDTKIQTLLSGQYGENGYQYFTEIFNEITGSTTLPTNLKTDRIDMLVDFMSSSEGFNSFIMSEGGEVYSPDVKWAWDTYWTIYEDAITNMPIGRKGRQLDSVLTDFHTFIKSQRTAGGQAPEEFTGRGPARMAYLNEQKKFQEVKDRLGQKEGIFEINENNEVVANEKNKQILSAWISNNFSDYKRYIGNKYYNERLGIMSPSFAPTNFTTVYDRESPDLLIKRWQDFGEKKVK